MISDDLSKLNYKISQRLEIETEILKLKYKIKKLVKYKKTKMNRLKNNNGKKTDSFKSLIKK
jgi:hypothetical protein